MSRTRFLVLGALASSACILDIPPSVPGASSGGSLVVPDGRSEEEIEGAGYGSGVLEDCAAACPRRPGLRVDRCHPTQLDGRVAQHRSSLGEPRASYIVCSYEVD